MFFELRERLVQSKCQEPTLNISRIYHVFGRTQDNSTFQEAKIGRVYLNTSYSVLCTCFIPLSSKRGMYKHRHVQTSENFTGEPYQQHWVRAWTTSELEREGRICGIIQLISARHTWNLGPSAYHTHGLSTIYSKLSLSQPVMSVLSLISAHRLAALGDETWAWFFRRFFFYRFTRVQIWRSSSERSTKVMIALACWRNNAASVGTLSVAGICDLWSVVCGLWSVVCCLLSMVLGFRFRDAGGGGGAHVRQARWLWSAAGVFRVRTALIGDGGLGEHAQGMVSYFWYFFETNVVQCRLMTSYRDCAKVRVDRFVQYLWHEWGLSTRGSGSVVFVIALYILMK